MFARAAAPAAAPALVPTHPESPRRPRALRWLAAVSVAYTLAQLLLVVPGSGLGWDETIYTSQVSGSVPAAFFSAPRARGISFLAAPVAELTGSVTALRVWMALLSGAGLFLALWVWRTLLPVRTLALAGALFATLWITLFYGPQVMPNVWSAYGVMLAVGCFLRAAAGRPSPTGRTDRTDRPALAGLACGVAVVGLMRPPDAVWLALPLTVAALAVPRLRRPVLVAVVALGVVLGCAEWVVEAYARYGGPAERLRLGSDIQGGMGWHVAVDDQIRSLDGRTLCRPCSVPWRHRATAGWFLVLPVLAGGGAHAAAVAGRRATALLPLAVAACVAAPYLFLIDYAAPRFLLPAYLLLAVPVADCLWWGLTRPGGGWRPGVAVLAALACGAHLTVQYLVLTQAVRGNRAESRGYAAVAADLRRAGVRPPCVITGDSSVPIAFSAGCASRQTDGPNASVTTAGLETLARRVPLAVLLPWGRQAPPYARHWRVVTLPDSPSYRHHRACVSVEPPRPGR